jgi:hypothetical protein
MASNNPKGRPTGIANKLCEEALAIFDEYERQYNWRPLADLIELAFKLKEEVNSYPDLSSKAALDTAKTYQKTLMDVMKYRHQRLKDIDITGTDEKLGNAFVQLLELATKAKPE